MRFSFTDSFSQEDESADASDPVVLPSGEARYSMLRTMLADHSYRTLVLPSGEETILDVTTANMLLLVADNLRPDNRSKFLDTPLFEMVDIGWKVIDRAKAKPC